MWGRDHHTFGFSAWLAGGRNVTDNSGLYVERGRLVAETRA
jgi:hypothetical protein